MSFFCLAEKLCNVKEYGGKLKINVLMQVEQDWSFQLLQSWVPCLQECDLGLFFCRTENGVGNHIS